MQRAVALAGDGAVITPDQLSPDLRHLSFASPESHATHGATSVELPEDLSLPEAVETLERNMSAEALRRNDGNVSRAARVLGLTRRGLQLKLGRYGIAATA